MQDKLAQVVLRTSLLYGLGAGLWILFSDRVLVCIVSDPVTIGRLSTYKSLGFVVVTTLLLYGALRSQLKRWGLEAAARRQAGETLRESEIRYREIFESMDDVYYQTDSQGIHRILSPSVYRLAGWKVEELIGRPVTDVYVDPISREKFLSILPPDGIFRDHEVLLKKKDGTPIQTSVRGHLRYDDQGRPAGVSGILRDISERKRAEEEIKHTCLCSMPHWSLPSMVSGSKQRWENREV